MKKAVFFIFILLLTSVLWAQNRYALIIGNADYPKAEDRLPNAINDTNAVSAALRELGFSVELKQNLRRLDMVKEISAFMTRLGSNRNSEGFLWYAGHAMEINGENLLFPLDVNIENDELIKATSFSLNDLTRQFGNAKNKVNVLVLDACRVPPSDSRSRGSGDVTRVIKTVPLTPPDLFVIYSTAPGTVALDGTGNRSPFAEAFLKNVKSAEPLAIMSSHVITDTLSLTGQRQRPSYSGSMGSGNAYYSLNPTGVRPSPGPSPQPTPIVTVPPIPRNVRAETPGAVSVTISWDSAGSGMSYRVYYSTRNDPPRSGIGLDGGIRESEQPSMHIMGLKRETNYYFWVTSIQNGRKREGLSWDGLTIDGQESEKSSVLTIKTASAPPVSPPPPTVLNMVRIQGGTFTMGSPEDEPGRERGETQRQVTVSSFYIGKYEVTQKEWFEVMGTTVRQQRDKDKNNKLRSLAGEGDNYPMYYVSWYEAIEYCNKRSQKDGLTPAYTISGSGYSRVTWNEDANGYRLPTPEEWEYACRAGTTTPWHSGATSDNLGDYAWYSDNSGGTTHPVGQKSPNAWGLYDMHGNVDEWSWYDDSGDAVGRGLRWLHGGAAIETSAQEARSAFSYPGDGGRRGSCQGFRLVRNE